MERVGDDQLDRSCEKMKRYYIESQQRERDRGLGRGEGGTPRTITRGKAKWIVHMLRRNCLLEHVTVGKMKRKIDMTGRRERRR